ncbi:hypothetical protein [Demequina rhizosphaerae]|uniref:hypothetical protein n=1 Tax=Demequina rhizosphaerae TaxID=1638985 RepID=UPI000ADECEA9|nr:hypothetical protein [Demequina rhizosphaerae]
MGQATAVIVLVATLLMFVGWCYAVVVVARRWNDSRYWAGYRERLLKEHDERSVARMSRAFPQGVFTLATPVLGAAGASSPLVLGYARGVADPTVPDAVLVVVVVCIGLSLVNLVLMAALWFFGRPRRLVPPALRDQ